MKTVKLALLGDDDVKFAEVDGGTFSMPPDASGTTLICGACDRPIIEGYKPDFFVMDDISLVCQHCGARNHMVLAAL